MKHKIMVICWCIILSFHGFASAATTTYTVASQVRNKSQVASYILAQSKSFAKKYMKHKNIHVFANDAHTASFLLDVTREVYDQIADDLGIQQIKKDGIYVTIFGLSDSVWHSFGLPDGVAALYMRGHNEIFVRLKQSNKNTISTNVAHELTHLVIDNIDPRAALWFHEGMAQFQSDKVFGTQRKLGGRYLEQKAILSKMKQATFSIDDIIDAKDYPRDVILFYELSYQMISYINKNGKMDSFSRNYLQYKTSFTSSLKQSVGYTFNSSKSFQRELAAFIKG